LAGILAPQLNDIGSSQGGVSIRPDTSVGDALTGVGNIFNLIGRATSGSPPRPSQTEQDNAALQPFNAELARLTAQRDQLGESRYRSLVSARFTEFSVNNGALITEAKSAVTALTGLEIGEKDFDPLSEQREQVEAFLETNIGKAKLPAIIAMSTDSDTGLFNTDKAFALFSAATAEHAMNASRLEALKFDLESLETEDAIRDERIEVALDEMILNFGTTAEEDVAGFSTAFFQGDARISDSQVVLAAFRERKALLQAEFESFGRQGGFSTHPQFKASMEAALSPYDNAINLVNSLGTDVVAFAERMRASDQADVLNLMRKLSVVGGSNQIYQDFVLRTQLGDQLTDLKVAIKGLDQTELRSSDIPLFSGTAETVTPDNPPQESPVTTAPLNDSSILLSDSERKNEVETNLAIFGTYNTVNHGGGENFRATAVGAFGMAATAVNTSSRPLGEPTFDKIYDATFFNTYNDIVKHGDIHSANLQNVVAENLGVVFNQRLGVVNTRISNFLDKNFPELQLKFDGNEAVLDVSGNKFLSGILKQNGFPITLEGARDLAISQPNNQNILAFSEARGVTQLINEIDYVNKIISVVRKLDDLSPHLLPSIGKAIENENFGGVFITNAEEYDALEDGTPYTYKNDDGTIGSDIK